MPEERKDRPINVKRYKIERWYGQWLFERDQEEQYILRLPRMLSNDQMRLLLQMIAQMQPAQSMPDDSMELSVMEDERIW